MPPRNIRKARALVDSEDEQEDSVNLQNLEEIKLLQQQRKRNAGLDANTLATGDGQFAAGSNKDADSQLLETYVKGKETTGMAGGDEDPHMKKYIEQELQKRRGKPVEAEPEDPAAAKRRRVEEELYSMPESLKGAIRPAEVVIPGLITGITEVALPLEARLQSIEHTEAIKRNLLAQAAHGGQDIEEAEAAARKQEKQKLGRHQFAASFGKPQQRKPKEPDSDPTRDRRYIKAPRESRF